MEGEDIFALRLKNARVMRGWSMDELVGRMNGTVSKMAISKYERKQLSPSSSVVIALSKAFELPVDYFFRPFALDIKSIKFRKCKSRLSVKEENAIRERVADLIERYISIEETCNASIEFSSPVKSIISTEKDVINAAEECRREWGLGTSGIVNASEFLEDHGIKIIEIESASSFDGLKAVVNEKYPVIVLNKGSSPERKRFTVFHELGHLIMNFSGDVDEKKEEKLCNLFAAEMLIPSSIFIKEIGSSRMSISYQEMKALQLEYGISVDALMYKAMYLSVITEQKYRSFCIRKNKEPSFLDMVEKSYYPESITKRFSSLVYRALSLGLITLSKAANLLNLSLDEVKREAVLV